MKPFFYRGSLSASKSLLNRAWIVKSFFPELEIFGDSQCRDVMLMKQAVLQVLDSTSSRFDCGAAGTVFRFLLTRLSREEGEFELFGDERLISRPHHNLFQALRQLGCEIWIEAKSNIRIQSKGWHVEKPLAIDLLHSSQFASGLLLSAWNLPKPLQLQLGSQRNSYSYMQMTIAFLRKLGMEILEEDGRIVVPAYQTLQTENYFVEPDMSSAFALAAMAACCGQLEILQFSKESLQPDFRCVEILQKMGVSADIRNSVLQVKQAQKLEPFAVDLRNNPDLFPVLAILLSRATGISKITGIETLVYKESNRISNIIDLLSTLGFSCVYQNKEFTLKGQANHEYPPRFSFDPDQDHRLAMAAALAQFQGAEIDILNPTVVDKSFPEFWEILESC